MYQITTRLSSKEFAGQARRDLHTLGVEGHIIAAHRIPFLFKYCGEEFFLSYPRHKDVVALPEIEIRYAFIRDPFQPPFG